MSALKICACGQPLHYKDRDQQRLIEYINARHGDTIVLIDSNTGRGWRVPRHFAVLHKFTFDDAQELAVKYGFPEVGRSTPYSNGHQAIYNPSAPIPARDESPPFDHIRGGEDYQSPDLGGTDRQL